MSLQRFVRALRTSTLASLVVAAFLICDSQARADDLDVAESMLEEGEFDAVAEAAERARESISSREELIRLYEVRARLAHALRDENGLILALRAVASLDPEHAFGAAVPPDLGERLAAIEQAPLEIDIRVSGTDDGVRLNVHREDSAGLVRQVRVHYRVTGGPWASAADTSIGVRLDSGATLEYWAEAMGVREIVLTRVGQAESPETYLRAPSPSEVAQADEQSSPPAQSQVDLNDGQTRRRRLLAGTISAGLLAVAAVVGGLIYASLNRPTQLQPPMIR